MSAAAALQEAAADALRGSAGLDGVSVFDAPPVRAALPFAVVEEPVTADWSAKDWSGREAKLTVTLHDAGERPTRLRDLAEAAETAVTALDRELTGGWRLASLALVKARIARAGGGERWTATSEFRVRMRRES